MSEREQGLICSLVELINFTRDMKHKSVPLSSLDEILDTYERVGSGGTSGHRHRHIGEDAPRHLTVGVDFGGE